MNPAAAHPRGPALRRGLFLVGAGVAWLFVEAGVALFSAREAHSVALLGFGFDSLVEIASAAIVGWRLAAEARGAGPEGAKRLERTAARTAGALLLALALYLVVRAALAFSGRAERAEASLPGVLVTALALLIMPLLARAKLRVAAELESAALRADAMEATCCAWMAATALAGLALNALFGWWWADPLSGLALAPLLAREGLSAWRERGCGCGA